MSSPSVDTPYTPSHFATRNLNISSSQLRHIPANPVADRQFDLQNNVPSSLSSAAKINRRIIRILPAPGGGHTAFGSGPLSAFHTTRSPSCVSLRSDLSHLPCEDTVRATIPSEDQHETAVSVFGPDLQVYPKPEKTEKRGSFSFTQSEAQRAQSQSEHTVPSPNIASLSDIDITHELRQPPVDPRKARRYCTDFGLSPDRRLPKEEFQFPDYLLPCSLSSSNRDCPSFSSAESTPLGTYTETDSDTWSLYQDIEFEFPNPPSDHPSLRRMQSSPLFTHEQTSVVQEFLRKRWSAKVKAKAGYMNTDVPPLVHQIASPVLDGDHERWQHRNNHIARELDLGLKRDTSLKTEDVDPEAGMQGCGMDMNKCTNGISEDWEDEVSILLRSLRTGTEGTGNDLPKPSRAIPKLDMPSDNVVYTVGHVTNNVGSGERINRPLSTSQASAPKNPIEKPNRNMSRECERPLPSFPSSRLPRIIRKVTSMRFPSRQRDDISSLHSHRLPKSRSAKFPPLPTNAIDRSEMNTEKLKAHRLPQHSTSKSASFASGNMDAPFNKALTDVHDRPPVPPSLASAGRKKPSYRAHLSAPLTGLDFPSPATDGSVPNDGVCTSSGGPRVLAAPFTHRATRSQPLDMIPPVAQPNKAVQVLKSFIDLTPEREVRRELPTGVRKERVRKLLARASNGVIGWGKNLTWKKSSE